MYIKCNPADMIIRCLSYSQLIKFNYVTEISEPFTCARCIVPAAGTNEALTNVSLESTSSVDGLQLKNYGSFSTLFNVYFNVLKFVNKFKCLVNKRLAKRIVNTWNLFD